MHEISTLRCFMNQEELQLDSEDYKFSLEVYLVCVFEDLCPSFEQNYPIYFFECALFKIGNPERKNIGMYEFWINNNGKKQYVKNIIKTIPQSLEESFIFIILIAQ